MWISGSIVIMYYASLGVKSMNYDQWQENLLYIAIGAFLFSVNVATRDA